MAAPVLSITVPRIVAVVPCAARRGAAIDALSKQNTAIVANVLILKPPRQINRLRDPLWRKYGTGVERSQGCGESGKSLSWRDQEEASVVFGAGVTLWNQSSFTDRMAAKYLSLSGGFTR